jgi:hypothetical protein
VAETQLFDVRGDDRCALRVEMLKARESDVSSTCQILILLNTTEPNSFWLLSFAFHSSSLSVLKSVRVGRGLVMDIMHCLQ